MTPSGIKYKPHMTEKVIFGIIFSLSESLFGFLGVGPL